MFVRLVEILELCKTKSISFCVEIKKECQEPQSTSFKIAILSELAFKDLTHIDARSQLVSEAKRRLSFPNVRFLTNGIKSGI